MQWYEDQKQVKEEPGDWWKFHRRSTEGLMDLSGSALKVLLVFKNHANNDVVLNDAGMGPGETFIGNRAVAKMAKVNFSRIHVPIKELMDKGYLVNVKKKGRAGTWIRRVVMNPPKFRNL